MKKNYPQNIFVHVPENFDAHALADKVNRFHVEVIERRLTKSTLTAEEKIMVIDRIVASLRSREINGVIH